MAATTERIRFMANNFVSDLEDSDLTVYGTATGYDKANVKTALRTKSWRSAGAFVVDASNLNLHINDGSDKTVALTVGTYTYSTLATHIQTQLNASSTGWTVAYDFAGGTFKFTISRSSSATLRFATTTNAAWDMLGYIGTVDETATSWVADEQRNHTAEIFQVDLGVARAVTFFAAITDADGVFPLSSQATITLKANSVNSWSSPPLEVSITPLGGGLLHFLDDLADTTYRYWQLEFEDRQNTVGPEGFHIGHIYLGDYETLASRNLGTGFSKYRKDPSKSVESEGGQLYWSRRSTYRVFDSMSVNYLEPADRTVLESIFTTVGRHTPFYVSLDPMLRISDDLDDLTFYAYFDDDPKFDHVISDMFSMKFALREAL